MITRCARLVPTMCTPKNPKDDKVASRYCFRAKCHMIDQVTGNVYGTFTGHDKTMRVTNDVYIACQLSLESFPNGLECDPEIELVLLEECPVECVREVIFLPAPRETQ